MSPEKLIETFGTIGLFIIIFAESGLLLGLIFPGDSLLFTAGLLASQNKFGLNIVVVTVGCFVAAVVGSQVGYWLGHRFGPTLFRRPDSRIFKQEYVERSRQFFDRHGSKTIVIARFVPFVRTLAPMLAGVGQMDKRTFFTFNVIGAMFWAVGVTVAGFFLGETVPDVDRYLLPIIAGIIVLSLIPPALEYLKHRRQNRVMSPAEAEVEADELEHILNED